MQRHIRICIFFHYFCRMTPEKILQKVEAALDGIRPYLIADGGNVEVVELTNDNILRVKLVGNCSSCPQRYMTFKAGIESAVKQAVPNILTVESVEDSTVQYEL